MENIDLGAIGGGGSGSGGGGSSGSGGERQPTHSSGMNLIQMILLITYKTMKLGRKWRE